MWVLSRHFIIKNRISTVMGTILIAFKINFAESQLATRLRLQKIMQKLSNLFEILLEITLKHVLFVGINLKPI